ncbi:MAG: TRAP transporter large permease subunit [Holophagales bacterium]|nr:TRAP transporter large permease subunit [Holophagales bacterium]
MRSQRHLARIARGFDRLEGWVGSALLLGMVLLLLAEMVLRTGPGIGVPGALSLVQHLTLWLAFVGAALAAGEGRLLALATGQLLPAGPWRFRARVFAATVAAFVGTLLARSSLEFVISEKEFGDTVAYGIPVWVALLVMPISLTLITVRLVWRAGRGDGEFESAESADSRVPEPGAAFPAYGWGRVIAAGGAAAGLWLGHHPELLEMGPIWPVLALLGLAMAAGAPIFAVLGGAAVLLFMIDAVPIAAVPVETYRLAVSPTLPAIPLFTLAGFLLAEGKAADRLVGVFRGLFGWIPGGTAVAATVVCAFFTVFTGGSGVTILALGGLLFQALSKDGYRERFSLGLLTASGSLGLLLPPALPLILYGIVAEVPIRDLFLGGMLPGILLVSLMAAWGAREGWVTGAGKAPFDARQAGRALWRAKWELVLPFLLVVSILGGLATPVEASALAVAYALFVQCVIHRDVHPLRDLPGVLRRCVVLVGGVLIILCVAMGFTSYLVDAQVPSRLLELVRAEIQSPLVFLLVLNVFLLLVGCLMDIFSATVVVVPLIVPLGMAFGIDPVHLGIIFIANLELGYLTPPVGLNLFLASYRFEKPLVEVYRAAIPMLVILGVGVLLITYLPWLTTVFLQGR